MNFKVPNTPEEMFGIKKHKLPNPNLYVVPMTLMFLVVFSLLTSFYSVGTDEVGIIKRFGKYVRTTSPGLRWKLPFNIETAKNVKVKRVFKKEFGFRTESAGVNTRYSTRKYSEESLMLTGDLNVIDVTWVVQFEIKDPANFLFDIRSPFENVRDISESVMRQVIGDSSVSEALSTRRIEINQEVEERLQKILDRYKSGIKIKTVQLQDVNPPDAVKASFNEVNEAKQEREKVINQSWEEYNKIIPKAKGQAEKTIREAEGYALARVNKAEGDASKFLDIYNAYQDSKEVTKRRMYLETLNEIMPKAGKIYVFDPKTNNTLPLLNLNGNENVK